MNFEGKIRLLIAGVVSLGMFLSGQAFAQCSGGGRGGPPSGSTGVFNANVPYASNSLASTYPSSTGLNSQQFQQSMTQVQDQAYAIANLNAQRQQAARVAYRKNVIPMKYARAEAKRAARAERIAARIAERDRELEVESSSRYWLASITDE